MLRMVSWRPVAGTSARRSCACPAAVASPPAAPAPAAPAPKASPRSTPPRRRPPPPGSLTWPAASFGRARISLTSRRLHMKTLKWMIPCLFAAVSIAASGCHSQDQAAADNNGAMSPSQAKAAIGEVTIGHLVGADGTIAGDQKGNHFTAGQPVFVSFMIGKAPARTPVTIEWSGPNNQALASDQKLLSRGESTMSFSSKDTSAWPPGDYHVDISVGAHTVGTDPFSVVAPDQAESTATKPGDAIGEVKLGHQLGADGSIAAGKEGKKFAPGEPVYVVFRSGSAPEGTNVEIEWYGPDNQKLLTDQLQVKPGDSLMHFASGRNGGWGVGDYHVDLLVNGQKVDSERFSFVDETKADKTKAGR